MRFNRFTATRRLTSPALLLSLCLLHGGVRPARAQLLSALTQTTTQTLAQTTQTYKTLNARAVKTPAGNVLQLAASSLVSFVSADRPVQMLGHLSATTGADAVREESGPAYALD